MPIILGQADLTEYILNALLTNSTLQASLPSYMNSSMTIFSRRPVPPDAPYPMVVISPDIAKSNATDGYSDQRPIVTRDITVYGSNDTADNYRVVEAMAYSIFDQFYRQRTAILLPDGWSLSDISARGPTPAPADDDLHVGRVVSVDFHLAHQD